jgi:hypothetical protein
MKDYNPNKCTGCPTRYRTRHFINDSNTNKDIATKFEHEYVRFVRNEEECVYSVSVSLQYLHWCSFQMALQPGVGLGLLYNVPPRLSIPCSVFPFI